MTRDLPLWAQNREALPLLASIIANPPESRVRTGDWGSDVVYRSWQRPDVAALKRMYREWWNANFEGATELPENPDALIHRLLNGEQLTEVHGDPFLKRRAA